MSLVYILVIIVIIIITVVDIIKKRFQFAKLLGLILVCVVILPIISEFVSDNKKVSNSDGFTIEKYDLILDVGIDNKVKVTEEINVNFFKHAYHGIYRYIPYWLEYTAHDGKTVKRKSKINNIQVYDDNFKVYTSKDGAEINIGNENKYVYGDKVYKLSYIYDMGEDPFNEFDEFIFHAFGDYWNMEIKNPSITINMPKVMDGNIINFYSDKYRKENINHLLDYNINGNTITIKGKSGFKLNSSLTLDVELPNNYFVGGSYNYGWKSFTITMICISITGCVILIWAKYGKNNLQVATVEFYPPDNLNAAEIGYIYNKKNSTNKLTIALIIQLASRGLIRIDEINDNARTRIMTTDLYYHNEVFDFSKVTKLEEKIFKDHFRGCLSAFMDESPALYLSIKDVDEELNYRFKKNIYFGNTKKYRIISIILCVIVAILSLISFYFVEDLDPKISFMYNISFMCALLIIALIYFMDKKTNYGELMYARIKGFKEFLETVEKEKLEALVENNPNYFYDILPYTYVLNISKKWIEKFENIPLQKNYVFNYNYRSGDKIFKVLNDNMYYPVSSVSSSTSIKSSSKSSSSSRDNSSSSHGRGGGCSSCGGGGSW